MSENTKTRFGEVSWNDPDFSSQDRPKPNKDLWLRLDEGENEVRLLTQPFQYLVHRYKKEGDAGYGQKISCSADNGSCPLCAAGDKAKPRWLLGVIDRKTGTYKILDVAYGVYSGIKALAKNVKHWGDPSKYDVCVIKNSNNPPTSFYTVQGIPKEPLSAADQLIKDQVDFEDLKRRVTPPTPEFVQKRIDKINNGNNPVANQVVAQSITTVSTKKTTKGKPPIAPVDMSDDEEDDAFPSYDESSS